MGDFILGDCMNKNNGLPSMPDNLFDFAIVDPPYKINASRPSKKPDSVLQKNGKRLKIEVSDFKHKDWDDKLNGVESGLAKNTSVGVTMFI